MFNNRLIYRRALLTAAAVIFASFGAMTLAADAGEVPLPRPKPVQAATCISIADTYKVIGAVETRGLGTVEYIAGEELTVMLDLFNRLPPQSRHIATSAIIITAGQPLRIGASSVIPANARDIRFFNNGCLVARSVFPGKNWEKFKRAYLVEWGTPA